jgi:hypothetical protein
VDICAQDAGDVRRWLEGQAWYDSTIANPRMGLPQPATAFSAGFDSVFEPIWDASGGTIDPDPINEPMWMRSTMRSLGASSVPEDVTNDSLRYLRSAIASCFFRPLADDTVTRVRRAMGPTDTQQPEDATMDLHAILSSRCSNFEIAWSDGRRAVRPIDYDGDLVDEIAPGDLIWFDISYANVGANRRRTFQEWRFFEEQAGEPQTDRPFTYTDANPRVEVPGGVYVKLLTEDPPAAPDPWANLLRHAVSADPAGIAPGEYSSAITNGERPANNPDGQDAEPNELLAIWGFRLPTGDGGYGRAWPKPAYIRVRITLHDAQNRISGGKQYEFVFSLQSDLSDRS